MGTHPIFESDFDCLTEFLMADTVVEVPINPAAGDVPSVKPAGDVPPVKPAADYPVIEEISDDPKVEEISEDPQIEEIDENAEDGAGDAQTEGKQSRAQKKVMKAMSKLNLKKVPGIMKVVMRNSKKGNLLFSIHGGEVYKVPGSDTYIVFGEAVPEDFLRNAQMKAAEKFKVPETTAPAAPLATIEDENEDDENVEVSTEGVEEKDIELVMQQAGVTKTKAIKALKNNGNDIVNAIMELTM